MFKSVLGKIPGMLMILAMASCLRVDQLSEAELEDVSPFYAFPLVSFTISSDDLVAELQKDANIRVNEEGIYTAFFSSDSFIRTKEDLFPKSMFGLPVPIIDSVVSLPVPTLSGLTLTKGVLKGDELVFLFNSAENDDVTLQVNLPELSRGGEPFKANFTIPFDGSAPSSLLTNPIDLRGFTVDFSRNLISLRYDARSTDGSRIVLPLSFAQISAFDFSYLEGSISRTVIPTGLQRIDIDIQDTLIQGSYQFQNPKIHFDIANNFGIPIGIKVKEVFIIGHDLKPKALVSDLFEEIIELQYPGFDQMGQVVTHRLSFDKDNSNLLSITQDDILAIDYDLDIIINPQNIATDDFFVLDDSRAVITAQIELSFEATVEAVSVEKIIDMDLSSLDSVSFLRLKLVSDNGLPLSFDPSLVLIDTLTGRELKLQESSSQMIESAKVDFSGTILANTLNVLYFQLDEDVIDLVQSMNRVKINLKLQSPQRGSLPSVIKPGQQLMIRIGAEVKLD